ncbi:MAG: hypothetical protein RLZZ340_543, partial [Actinomycetota bacterium]
DKYEMYKLVDFKSYQPTLARPNSEGKITVAARVRASLSKFYFQDRVTPVGQVELAAAAHHDDHAPAIEAQPEAKKPAAKKAAPKAAAKKTATTNKASEKAPAKKPATKKAAPKKK